MGNVANLAHLIKRSNSFIHDEDAAYLQVPSSQYEVGQILLDTADRSPGVYSWLYTNDLSSCVAIAHLDSTNPKAVEHIMEAVQAEAQTIFNELGVKVSVAGGSIGIASAFNRNVGYWLLVGGLLGLLGTLVLAVLCIRSIVLSLILLIPLIVGMIVALAAMYVVGIRT